MSQPCNRNCNTSKPGDVDAELGEFWEGSPWKIFEQHNLSCFERNRVFLNAAGQSFLDISALTGADSDGDGRCVVATDFNHDGRQDLLVRQAGGGPLLAFENRFPQRNFLKVTLRGVRSNRLGIGARLTARTRGGQMHREVFPLNSYRSQAALDVHFGLGQAERVEQLVVRWPSGEVDEFADVPANQHIVLTEGRPGVETVQPGTTISP